MPDEQKNPKKLSIEEFSKLQGSCYLIDVRPPDVFARGFIKDSINIPPVGGSFHAWAMAVLSHDDKIILIVEDESHVPEIMGQLTFVGLHHVLGYIVWDKNLKAEMETLDICSVNDLSRASDVFIVDVRTLPEWNMGHIPQAHHMELSKLKEHLKEIPKDQKIATVCGAGFRSSIAASILQKNGFTVASTEGGMKAWNRANLEIQTDEKF